MINKIKLRGNNRASTKSSLKYIRKYQGDPEKGGPSESSIGKREGTSEQKYQELFEKKMEGTRQKGQKNLYAFVSLSFSHADSKEMTDEKALEIAKDFYLNEAYPGSRHYEFTVENDKEHKHVHAMIGLTNLETKKVNNKFVDFKPIADKLEKKYGLEQVARTPFTPPTPFAPSSSTKKIEDRTGEKTKKNDLKESISSAFLGSDNFNDFLDNLKNHDVNFVPTANANGLCGATFEKNGEMFKGSQLGYAAGVIKAKYEGTQGYSQYVEFAKQNRLEMNKTKNMISGGEADVNKKIFLGKNFTDAGDKVLYKDTNKIAYKRKSANEITFETSNLKNVSQAVKEMKQRNKDCVLNTNTKSEQHRKNIWIAAKQNDAAVNPDMYQPSKNDYQFAIKNCFNEKAKEKLQNEFNNAFPENAASSKSSSKMKLKM